MILRLQHVAESAGGLVKQARIDGSGLVPSVSDSVGLGCLRVEASF